MSYFICPICSQPLQIKGKSYVCKNNHSFDISAKGYVNLLPANKKRSANPGDDKGMVMARNNFLSLGYYGHLKDRLGQLCDKYSENNVNILDCGCGEGYYTAGICEKLEQQGKMANIQGIDISKCSSTCRKKTA